MFILFSFSVAVTIWTRMAKWLSFLFSNSPLPPLIKHSLFRRRPLCIFIKWNNTFCSGISASCLLASWHETSLKEHCPHRGVRVGTCFPFPRDFCCSAYDKWHGTCHGLCAHSERETNGRRKRSIPFHLSKIINSDSIDLWVFSCETVETC